MASLGSTAPGDPQQVDGGGTAQVAPASPQPAPPSAEELDRRRKDAAAERSRRYRDAQRAKAAKASPPQSAQGPAASAEAPDAGAKAESPEPDRKRLDLIHKALAGIVEAAAEGVRIVKVGADAPALGQKRAMAFAGPYAPLIEPYWDSSDEALAWVAALGMSSHVFLEWITELRSYSAQRSGPKVYDIRDKLETKQTTPAADAKAEAAK